MFVWVIDLLVNIPSPHPRAPARPFTLEVLQAKEHAPTPSSPDVFILGLAIESIKELGGVSMVKYGDIDGKDFNMHMDVIKHEPNQKIYANCPLETF
jgi:hypothetical protein